MKNLADNFNTPGQTILDDELILYLVGGLGTEYESVIIHLTSRQGDQDLQVQFMLQSQDMRIDTANSVQVAENYGLTANLSADTAYSGKSRGGFKRNRVGFKENRGGNRGRR